MRKIYAYGDSFIANESKIYPGWAQILSNNLNASLCNKGVSAGSTENAMTKLYNDMDTVTIGDNDIVLFQTSTPGRLHFLFQRDRPETASLYTQDSHSDFHLPEHTWYRENKQYINWYLRNFDINLMSLNHYCYLNTVINFAASNPNIKIVVLSNIFTDKHAKLPKPPTNCIMVPIELHMISKNEFANPKHDHTDWLKHVTYDTRINHLSNKNLALLAELIEESIDTGRTDNFSYSRFVQRIFEPIRTDSDYLRYIEQGHLYNIPDWLKFKK